MLNTDAHNPAIPIKDKMSLEDWKKSNARLPLEEEVPEAFLENLYHKIVQNEIKMEMDGVMFGSAEKKGWLVKEGGKIKTWKRRYFVLTPSCLYYFREIEVSSPLPSLCSFSFPFPFFLSSPPLLFFSCPPPFFAFPLFFDSKLLNTFRTLKAPVV